MKFKLETMHKQNKEFPWYDSPWLFSYRSAQKLIKQNCPERLNDFEDAFEILKTRDDFIETKLDSPILDAKRRKEIKQLIKDLPPESYAKHEFLTFGRLVVHDLPYFTELQHEFCDLVSNVAGEPLEPCYNFLSLYNNLGDCEMHMDAPTAKWTLDMCIEQSAPWPIYFSQVRPWPELGQFEPKNWSEKIKNDPDIVFSEQVLYPGEGLVFSGSSQWHYRDRIKNLEKKNFCHLIFFHYIPEGTHHLMSPRKWADFFDLPILQKASINGNNIGATL